MRDSEKPVPAGKAAAMPGTGRRETDKASAALKKEGTMVPPVHRKPPPAQQFVKQ